MKKKKHSDLLLSCRCCLFLFFLCLSWVSLCSHLWHGLTCGSGRCCGWGCPLLVLGHLQTIITFALTLVVLCIEHAEDSDALVFDFIRGWVVQGGEGRVERLTSNTVAPSLVVVLSPPEYRICDLRLETRKVQCHVT